VTIDLRLGRWQDVMQDVECDALICDPPYSARTHGCQQGKDLGRTMLSYAAWSEDDISAFVNHWGPRTRGWIAVITDHILVPIFASAMEMPENGGRYVFAPIPIVETGSRVRLTGDGPSSWTCYLVVGRPKCEPYSKWGTLPGAYIGSGRGDREHIGGKDSGIMRAIVRDYSRPGDLVCDPCLGAATTAYAAACEGRRFVGCEMDPETFAKAQKRVSRGYTPTLFDADRPMVQRSLLGSDE
jgi:hypothetical protein